MASSVGARKSWKSAVNIRRFLVYISGIWGGGKIPWADWAQLFGRRYPRRNHVFQIWWRSVKGFSVGWGSNFATSHWLWRSVLVDWHHFVLALSFKLVSFFYLSQYIITKCIIITGSAVFIMSNCSRRYSSIERTSDWVIILMARLYWYDNATRYMLHRCNCYVALEQSLSADDRWSTRLAGLTHECHFVRTRHHLHVSIDQLNQYLRRLQQMREYL